MRCQTLQRTGTFYASGISIGKSKCEEHVAVNKPAGDNARKGAVKKRSQTRTTLRGATAWTKRSKVSGEFMAVKKPAARKTAAKKFKGVRVEKQSRSR